MIAPIRSLRDTQRTSRAGAARSGGFTAAQGAGEAAAAPTARALGPASQLGSLDALLALQTVTDPVSGRARAARRGTAMLDDLDALKVRLLEGRIGADLLVRIAARLDERPDASDDPELDALLADIELRARVELAKLGR